MRWRKLSEEPPKLGQRCLCRHDYYNNTAHRYGIFERVCLTWINIIFEWQDEWGIHHPRYYAGEWWCPIEEVEALMENGICEGSANTAEK